MPGGSALCAHRAHHIIGVVAAVVVCGITSLSCSGGGNGPEERSGLLEIIAVDTDHPSSDAAPAGFELADVTSFRVRLRAGTRVVLDSTFTRDGAVERGFQLRPDTYVAEVEAFQSGDVLLLRGAGEATVTAGDTVPLTVDLDPAVGDVDLTIGGQTAAVVPTNGTAPVRAVVRNDQGQPVQGARVVFTTDPASAGTVTVPGSGETGADGALDATFVPAGGEAQGRMLLTVDGAPVVLDPAVTFSIVSPVDPGLSALTLTNTFRLPADGASTSEIRAHVVDKDGNALAGIPVVVKSSRNSPADVMDTIRSDQTKTDGAGDYVARLSTFSSSNLAGDATITATADGKTMVTTGTINFLSIVSAGASTIHVAPQLVPADGTSAADLTINVRTVTGASAPNVLVQLKTRDDSVFHLQPGSGRTNSAGVFRSRISSSTEGGTIIDVFADGLKTSATGFVLFN